MYIIVQHSKKINVWLIGNKKIQHYDVKNRQNAGAKTGKNDEK